jgi:hypothetical protein
MEQAASIGKVGGSNPSEGTRSCTATRDAEGPECNRRIRFPAGHLCCYNFNNNYLSNFVGCSFTFLYIFTRRKMKKYCIVFLLFILIIPSFANAAWWNPFTWNWNPFTWFGVDTARPIILVPEKSSSSPSAIQPVLPKQILSPKSTSSSTLQPQKQTVPISNTTTSTFPLPTIIPTPIPVPTPTPPQQTPLLTTCTYPAPPTGCIYASSTVDQGGIYNPATNCGLLIFCVSPPPQAIGPTTITINVASSIPSSALISMGSTGNPLAKYVFTTTSRDDNAKITDLTIWDSVGSGATASFNKISLYNGLTLLSTANPGPAPAANFYAYVFHFSSPLIVPLAGPITLDLRGDVPSYTSGGGTDNSTHVFSVVSVTAFGQSRGNSAGISGGATGNTMTVVRSALIVNISPSGMTSGRIKTFADDLATITFGASSGGDVVLNSLTFAFSGTAINGTDPGISLIDNNNSDIALMGGVTSSTTSCNGGMCKKWNFSGNGFQISSGNSYSFKLRMNTANTAVGQNGTAVYLNVTIQNPGDIQYTDGLGSPPPASATHGLTPLVATPWNPLNVTAVTFVGGS